MVKKRPVIVVSVGHRSRQGLATVVPLSTKRPNDTLNYHLLLENKLLPRHSLFQNKENWVKGDMINTVSYDRLSPIGDGRYPDGKRRYLSHKLSRDTMKLVYSCVLCGLNLGDLAQYLFNDEC